MCHVDFIYIMHNVQDYSVLNNNVVRSVVCEGWHIFYSHVENTLSSTKMGGFDPYPPWEGLIHIHYGYT